MTKEGAKKMFKEKSLIEKVAALALAAAPMLLGTLLSFVWWGEPEIPTQYKK